MCCSALCAQRCESKACWLDRTLTDISAGSLMMASGDILDLDFLRQGVHTGCFDSPECNVLTHCVWVFFPTHSLELDIPHLGCFDAFQSYWWENYSANLHVFDYRWGKTSFYFLLPFPPHSLPLESCVSQLIFLCVYSSFPGWFSSSHYIYELLTLTSHATDKKPPS